MVEIVIKEANGATVEELSKLKDSCKKLEETINSKKFQSKILLSKFTSTKKTSYEVLRDILNVKDKTIELTLEMYYKNNSVVGYTYPHIDKIWINRKFFKNYTQGEVAGNLMHETLHNLGYDHRSAKDKNSVPYLIGYIIKELIDGPREVVSKPKLTILGKIINFFKRIF